MVLAREHSTSRNYSPPTPVLPQLGRSANQPEIEAVLARPDGCTPVLGGDDPSLARALLQVGLSTSLEEIKAAVADLKHSLARLKRERQDLLEMQRSRSTATHAMKDSWHGRGLWIIG